jgi:hypothetical protein
LNHFNIFILKKDILGREYSVDEVLDDKIENGISKYLIKWKHFGPEYNEWVSEKKMGCNQLKQNYLDCKKYINTL